MMMASPFSGGFGGGNFNGGFGYPQVGALGKKRSLGGDQATFGQRGILDLFEHVSTTIEDLTKKYSNHSPNAQHANNMKRVKPNESASTGQAQANFKPATTGSSEETNLNNNVGVSS